MKLLNSKPIIDCNESDEIIHNNEINNIYEKLSNMNNINCVLAITDSFNNEPKFSKCKICEVLDLFEYFDIKNGIDIYQDEDFLTFVLNGQTYQENKVTKIFYTFIKILPLDANDKFLKIYISDF